MRISLAVILEDRLHHPRGSAPYGPHQARSPREAAALFCTRESRSNAEVRSRSETGVQLIRASLLRWTQPLSVGRALKWPKRSRRSISRYRHLRDVAADTVRADPWRCLITSR